MYIINVIFVYVQPLTNEELNGLICTHHSPPEGVSVGTKPELVMVLLYQVYEVR